MVDTIRELAALQALLADNTSGDISPQDIRDFLVSAYPFAWRPATVGDYDDYFDADNESDWTQVAPDTGTVTWDYHYQARKGEYRGVMGIADNQTASDLAAFVKPLSGITTGDYIQADIYPARNYVVGGVRWTAGLVLTNGTTSSAAMAGFGLGADNNATPALYSIEGTLTAAAGTFRSFFTPGFPAHWRLIYQASNTFRIAYSIDGENFVDVATDISESFTPTHGGFIVESENGNGSGGLFRYFHSNVTP